MTDSANEITTKVHDFLAKILTELGASVDKIDIKAADHDLTITIVTSQAPLLIGRYGQTIDALRHLVSLFLFNLGFPGHVSLDVNDYYKNKDDQLLLKIDEIIDQVVATQQPKHLFNLSARERRLVHLHCADRPQVITRSIDTDRGRVLVISPTPNDQ
ncbi:MAG: KH domain-containing protein [bacterium]|nr:KH domain-containing protein [bacterium]